VGCDQVTKSLAREHLSLPQPIRLLGDVFRLQYAENTGAFLGLGASLPPAVRFWSFVVAVTLLLIGTLVFVWTSAEMNRVGLLGGSLVVGGGLGNLIDRLLYNGAVIDFMNMGVGRLRTGVFNVADVAIMVGVGLLLLTVLRAR
jgi:signal peptidase II